MRADSRSSAQCTVALCMPTFEASWWLCLRHSEHIMIVACGLSHERGYIRARHYLIVAAVLTHLLVLGTSCSSSGKTETPRPALKTRPTSKAILVINEPSAGA